MGRVRTLCDIGETCRRYGDAIDWSQLIARACAYDLAKPLYYSLRLARELIGAGVPSQALMALRASFDQLPLEDRFIAACARRALLRDAQPTCSRLSPPLAFVCCRLDGREMASPSWAVILLGRLSVACDGSPHGLYPVPLDELFANAASHGAPDVLRRPPSRYPRACGGDLRPERKRWPRLSATAHLRPLRVVAGARYQVRPHAARTGGLPGPHAPARRAYRSRLRRPLQLVLCAAFRRLRPRRLRAPSRPYPNEKRIEQYRRYAAATGRPVLLRAHEPYGYTDLHPEAYSAVRAISPYRDFRREGPIRICIHVRRGDRILSRDPRLLSNAYYLRACEAVVNALQEQRVSFVVRLHTEAPSRPCTVYPGFAGNVR